MNPSIVALMERLKTEDRRVLIQTHDFPDPDAVASAFGLQSFLHSFRIFAEIVYKGEIYRDSLLRMIEELEIPIYPENEMDVNEQDLIIIVDGCKGQKNVSDLPGEEIAVIDHHENISPEEIFFSDIRKNYGSCCSIIFSYYEELDVVVLPGVATALLIGINSDTSSLTRGVSEEDLEAFYGLFPLADNEFVNSVLRNNIEFSDLPKFSYLISHLKSEGTVGFCYFPMGCPQNLLGILADFMLALKEIEFVILCAKNGHHLNFSLRNEDPKLGAQIVIRNVLHGRGFGGGHIHMAGGVILNAENVNEDALYTDFLTEIRAEKHQR